MAIDNVPRRVDIVGAADSVDTSTLGGRIAWARLRKSMTQKDLSIISEKSRATVVQYENNNILPPIDVVEKIGKALGVSPSYIAYGEHVVEGIAHKEIEMVSFPEVTFGRDASFVSSTFAFAKSLVTEYKIQGDAIVGYVLSHDAPQFHLVARDRLIVNTAIKEPAAGTDLYILETATGMEVVRFEPEFGKPTGQRTVKFTGSKGQVNTAKLSDLTILGAVAAKITTNFD